MEQRREPRLNLNKAVILRVVSLMGEVSAGRPMNARVLEISGSGVRLELDLPVPCGAAVEIEDQRTRMVGETLRCDANSKGYVVAVRVSETMLLADV